MTDAYDKESTANGALETARNCRHCAMCKVDYLAGGVCASGRQKQYAAFYPEGRMDLYAALMENTVPVTEMCVEIADGCNLCGRCDHQCYFVHEMRPSKVMKALKDHVDAYKRGGGEVFQVKEDAVLLGLREIVGDFWATNDPAVRIAYHHDLCPHVEFRMPKYIVMPGSKEEVSAVIKLLNCEGISYVVRGNGASSHGLVFTLGAVLDLQRMKTIDFDEKNWCVKAGPGVNAFQLQQEAYKRGFRVNTAEPAALVCANVMTSGLISTFSTAYGIAADNFVNAEFVLKDGSRITLNDLNAPNLFSYQNELCEPDALAVCVWVSMKLYPVTKDEGGVLVPFQSLHSAMDFAKTCALRHIGLAIGILGADFISTFISPTKKLAQVAREAFEQKLDMPYLVLLIGDDYALRAVKHMGLPVISQKLYKALSLGLPSLRSAGWLDLLDALAGDEPYSYLRTAAFEELAEVALAPSSSKISKELDEDLCPFFERLYERPEMTDLTWLNTFRIQSMRYVREKPCVALVCYLPMDTELILEIQQGLLDVALRLGIKSGFGFITPIDCGKRCGWEYDYYFDHNDPEDLQKIRQATQDAGALLDAYSKKAGTIRQVRYVVNRGCCRKENLLYV
jgi:hypothetical protein